MPTGSITRRPLRFLLVAVCAVFTVALFLACALVWRLYQQYSSYSLQATATSEAESLLTRAHGTEVGLIIQNFRSRWLSLEDHKDPSIESQLATGPYLEYMGLAREGQAINNEPSWLITTSAAVARVRVLDYGPARLEAIAHVTTAIDEITPEGELKQSLRPDQLCGVYVFVRQDGQWKLAAYFDAADSQHLDRDWKEAPDWLKQIIGELPSEVTTDCGS